MFPIAELSRFVVVIAAISALIVPCGLLIAYEAFGTGQVGFGLLGLSLALMAGRVFSIAVDPLDGRS